MVENRRVFSGIRPDANILAAMVNPLPVQALGRSVNQPEYVPMPQKSYDAQDFVLPEIEPEQYVVPVKQKVNQLVGVTPRSQQNPVFMALRQRIESRPSFDDVTNSIVSSFSAKPITPEDAMQQRLNNLLIQEKINNAKNTYDQIKPSSIEGKILFDLRNGIITEDVANQALQNIGLKRDLMQSQIQAYQALGGERVQRTEKTRQQIQDLKAKPSSSNDKPLPADLAGRVGFIQNALKEIPNAEKIMSTINLTNPMDIIQWGLGTGKFGDAKILVTQSVEAALRAMSGAGVPQTEVDRYSKLYMPQATDTPQRVKFKLNQIKNALNNIANAVSLGRLSKDTQNKLFPSEENNLSKSPEDADDDFNAYYETIPSGEIFVDPEGNERIKP